MADFACDNCGEHGPVSSLNELSDEDLRTLAQTCVGLPVPAGACPSCATWCDAKPTPEEEAHQRAKEAGPELLAALRDLIPAAENMVLHFSRHMDPSESKGRERAIEAARNAIAKAEGETLEAMSEEWERWCRAEGFECVEAEEMLLLVKLTPAQTAFVTEFCERWERIERKGPSGV